MMDKFMDWALLPLSRLGDFSGRSRRKEYWSFAALGFGVMIAVSIVEGILGLSGLLGWSPLSLLVSLALLVPGLGVTIRRLQDGNRSGWFAALALIPVIGSIALIILCLLEGTPGNNRYGPDPRGTEPRPASDLF